MKTDYQSNLEMARNLGYVVSKYDTLVPYDHEDSALKVEDIKALYSHGFPPGTIRPLSRSEQRKHYERILTTNAKYGKTK